MSARSLWSRAAVTAAAAALTVAGCSSPEPPADPAPTVEQQDEITTPAPEVTEDAAPEAAEDTTAEDDQREALDRYVALEEASTPDLLELFDGVYGAIDVRAEHPGTVEFEYVFAEQVDPDLAVPQFDTQIEAMQEACDEQVFPAMAAHGIHIDPQVRYIYLNADGSDLWAQTFTPS